MSVTVVLHGSKRFCGVISVLKTTDEKLSSEITITLNCMKCGWVGKQPVRMIIMASGRIKHDTFGIDGLCSDSMVEAQHQIVANNGSLVVPHPVECLKCGAVNSYKVTSKTWFDIMILSWKKYNQRDLIQKAHFHSKVGNVHPLVAGIHYAFLAGKNPTDHQTVLRMANAFRSGGSWAVAAEQYEALLENMTVPAWIRAESAYNLALMAGYYNNFDVMVDLCQYGLEICRSLETGRKNRKCRKPLNAVGFSVPLDDVIDSFRDLIDKLSGSEGLDTTILLRMTKKSG